MKHPSTALLFVAAATAWSAPAFQSAPHHPRSGSPATPLFRSVPTSESGIMTVNRYDDPRMWAELYQELVYGAIGSGVAAGDFNGDGRPDLFIGNKCQPPRLYRNEGGWKFTDVTEAALIWPKDNPWVQGVTWSDVNNDGLLDLYVCRFGAPNLLYVNRGNGTFSEEAAKRGLAVSDASGMAIFGDYDRDGWLDVYLQTNLLSAAASPDGQEDRLFHNRGDGTFEEVTKAAGISGRSFGHAALWWDYNEDGWPDLYVSNDYAVPDRLYENQRDGTFKDVAATRLPSMPYYSMGSDVGDADGNGHLDLLATDMAASTHEKDLRGMAGSRSRTQMTEHDPAAAPQLMRNVLYLNEGYGLFREGARLAGIEATDWTWSPRWEDYDGDGRLDLIVTNGMLREYHNADLLQRIMGQESQSASREVMRGSPLLVDGGRAFRNGGQLAFADVTEAWGLRDAGVSFGSATADFDGDGDPDLVRIRLDNTPELLENRSAGHALTVSLRGRGSNLLGIGARLSVQAGPLSLTRPLMLGRGYLSSSEPKAFFGLGAQTRAERLEILWPNGRRQVVGPVDADQHLVVEEPTESAKEDAASAAAAPLVTVTELPFPNQAPARPESTAQPFLPWSFDQRGPALARGTHALAIGGTRGTPLRILSGVKEVATLPLDPDLDDGPLLWVDADGDGDEDLIVTKLGAAKPAGAPAYQPRLWLNDGHDGFTPGALPPFPVSVGALASADIDGDGDLDLFVGGRNLPGRYPNSPRSAFWLKEGIAWTDATERLAPVLKDWGMIASALWIDLDDDGSLELVAVQELGTVRVLKQSAPGHWTDETERYGFSSAGSGLWTSIAVADFNGDGRPDFVIGNAGLNTPLRGDPTFPDVFLWGDFREGGAPLLAEARTERDRLVPRRPRADWVNRIPAVAKRQASNDAYARASLEEVLTPPKVASAKRWNLTELRSGVLLSGEAGRWRFAPLPTGAQLAPVQGVITGDYNGDGHTDVVVVQNLFSASPFLGRFTGGTGAVLMGDGRGSFAELPPARSGWVVRGDAKSLLLDEGPGGVRFLATRNGSPLLSGALIDSAPILFLKLQGPAPTWIGARLTVKVPGLAPQISFVAFEQGYQTQGGRVQVFGTAGGGGEAVIEARFPDGRTRQWLAKAGTRRLDLNLP